MFAEFVDDPTFMEAANILPKERKRKTRNSNKTLLREGAQNGGKRKRRVRRASSSSSDEGERLFTQQEQHVHPTGVIP